MERQGIIKYFECCFNLLDGWFTDTELPEGRKELKITITHGIEKAKPFLTNNFLFGFVDKEKGHTTNVSCCIIIDKAFVNVWYDPEWEDKKRYNYFWPEKRAYFVDGSNELVQDSYEDRFGLRFPADSYYPIGIPDLFVALKGIVQIEVQ